MNITPTSLDRWALYKPIDDIANEEMARLTRQGNTNKVENISRALHRLRGAIFSKNPKEASSDWSTNRWNVGETLLEADQVRNMPLETVDEMMNANFKTWQPYIPTTHGGVGDDTYIDGQDEGYFSRQSVRQSLNYHTTFFSSLSQIFFTWKTNSMRNVEAELNSYRDLDGTITMKKSPAMDRWPLFIKIRNAVALEINRLSLRNDSADFLKPKKMVLDRKISCIESALNRLGAAVLGKNPVDTTDSRCSQEYRDTLKLLDPYQVEMIRLSSMELMLDVKLKYSVNTEGATSTQSYRGMSLRKALNIATMNFIDDGESHIGTLWGKTNALSNVEASLALFY